MKIKSCNIASFGKFQNYKIDFSDGLNVFYGDNEAGKSTIMSFIKMMFYGNAGRVSDISRNLRTKYMPWNSPLMAGSIEFSQNGKNYRIEREFRGSNATDKITIIDLDLKTEIKVGNKGDIGSEIFGLSEAAFEKSVFIGGLGAPEKNTAAEGELNGKLSNIASTGDEDISFELVSKRIKKAKEFYMSKSGKIGVYDKTVARLSELEKELLVAKETEESVENLESQIKFKEEEILKVSAEGNRLFTIMKKAELFKKKANLQKYVEAYNAKADAEKMLKLPNGSYADKQYADDIKKSLSIFETAENNLTEKQKDEDRLRIEIDLLSSNGDNPTLSVLSEKKKSLENELTALGESINKKRADLIHEQILSNEKSKKKKINLPLITIGIILAVIGGVLTVIKTAAFALLSIIGIFLLILSFITGKTETNAVSDSLITIQSELDAALSKQAEAEGELQTISSQLNETIIEQKSNKALIDSKQSELLLKGEATLAAKNELFERKKELVSLCEPFGNIEDALKISNKIESLLSNISAAEIRLNLAADGTNASSIEEATARLSDLEADESINNITAEEVATAKDEFKAITDCNSTLKEELASLKGKLKALISSGRTVPVILHEQDELRRKMLVQKKFCDAADIALETLADSFSAMRQSFGSLLEEKTSKIFKGLSNNKYPSLEISKDFDIKVNCDDVFGSKDWQFLSAGTVDQAYLSLRLAIAELIGNEANPFPIIMDDVLTQYDDKRCLAAMKYFLNYSKEHQLILFTCHDSIKQIADKLGVITKEI